MSMVFKRLYDTETITTSTGKKLKKLELFASPVPVIGVTGLYDADDNLVASWNTLVNTYGMDCEKDYTSSTYETDTGSPYYILTNNSELSDGVNLFIDDSVTSIGSYAFYNCTSLTSVTIPDSVTSIGRYAFEGCTSLKYNEYDNAYYLGNNNNPYVVLMKAKSTDITSCDINSNTKVIYDSAFAYRTSLTSVTIPDSVTSIGEYAFYNCTSLTSVTIPDSVTSIGEYAFYNCTSLTSINVDENNNNYKSVDGNLYSKDGKTLIQYAIGKKDTTFTIPDTVMSIGDWAFYNCTSLTSVTIPDTVTSIGDWAFSSCTSLTSVTIPDSVMSIGDWAFYNCTSLTSVTIPDSVMSIGSYAFEDCTSLASVTIGDSVTFIGYGAFKDCTSLTEIHYNGTKAQWNSIIKYPDWNISTGNYTIYCTDGNISK